MSRNQRIGLIVVAVVVAVVAFVIASSGGDDNTDTATKTTGTTTSTKTGTDTSPTPTQPLATMIRISGNKVAGGSTEVHAKNGDAVEIVVSADAPTVLHLHGYEIEKTAKPGQPARFRFKANLEGQFDLESHTAEDAGLDPLVAKVIVEPK